MFAGVVTAVMVVGTPLSAQTNADQIARLTQRVDQLEKQVQEISRFLEPLKGQQATISSRRQALQGKVQNRFMRDQEKYSAEQVLEAEKLFHVVSQKPGTEEASQSFQMLLEKFPDINRTGCAVLYIAQRSQGEERVKYLQQCIEKYSDCIYGDGVQVGAYARFLLAREYSIKGEDQKAQALSAEIKSRYPDAIDHAGNSLMDIQITK